MPRLPILTDSDIIAAVVPGHSGGSATVSHRFPVTCLKYSSLLARLQQERILTKQLSKPFNHSPFAHSLTFSTPLTTSMTASWKGSFLSHEKSQAPPSCATNPCVFNPVADDVPAICARYVDPSFAIWSPTLSK